MTIFEEYEEKDDNKNKGKNASKAASRIVDIDLKKRCSFE